MIITEPKSVTSHPVSGEIKAGDRVKWEIIGNFGIHYQSGHGTFVKWSKLGNGTSALVEVSRIFPGSFKHTSEVPLDYVQHHYIGRYMWVDKVSHAVGCGARKFGIGTRGTFKKSTTKSSNKFSSISKSSKVMPIKAFVEYISDVGIRKIEPVTNLKTISSAVQALVNKGAQKNTIRVYEVSGVKKVEFTEHVTVRVI